LLARVTAGAVLGIDAYLVTVEADVSSGLPAFYLVGLPQGAVKEARDRVHAGLANSGQYLPPRKYTLDCGERAPRGHRGGARSPLGEGAVALP
jgi:magnesium chelatase family protein